MLFQAAAFLIIFFLILVSYYVFYEIIHSHAFVVNSPKIGLGTHPPPLPWQTELSLGPSWKNFLDTHML